MPVLNCVDLLEKGRTTGQAARLLYDPPRREQLELEAAKAKQAEEQSKASKKKTGAGKAAATTKAADKAKAPEPVQSPGIHPDDDDEEEDEEEEEEMEEAPAAPERYWFGLVCYGLPNLAVTGGKN